MLPLVMIPFYVMEVDPHSIFWVTYGLFVFLLVYVILLNLMPIPPLDGYGIIEPYLPRSWQEVGEMIRPMGLFLVIMIAWNSPYLAMGAYRISEWLGVDIRLVVRGWEAVRSF